MGHLRACAREALAAGLYYFVSIYYHAAPWARFAHYSLTLMHPLTREWFLTAAPLCVVEASGVVGSTRKREASRPRPSPAGTLATDPPAIINGNRPRVHSLATDEQRMSRRERPT
jgi:hypothetical protein